jgi:hypothetical protein
MLVSILMLIILNIKKLWDYLNITVLAPQGGLDKIIAEKAPALHNLLNSLFQSVALQFLFWLFIGCVIYIFIWFAKNIVINIRNDLVADRFLHPLNYQRYKYWESVISRKVFFWISIAVLAIYIISCYRLVVSLAASCYNQIEHFHSWSSLAVISEAVLATTGIIYILVLLLHLVINTWQLIYKDL